MMMQHLLNTAGIQITFNDDIPVISADAVMGCFQIISRRLNLKRNNPPCIPARAGALQPEKPEAFLHPVTGTDDMASVLLSSLHHRVRSRTFFEQNRTI
ncbi:hypothetical protein ACWKX9_23225 [Enterobacter asburiae]